MLAFVMASLLLKMTVVGQVKETFYILSLILIYLTRSKAPLDNFTFWLPLYLIFVKNIVKRAARHLNTFSQIPFAK
jgi:hypothetical protein